MHFSSGKRLSELHEKYVASKYEGRRSPSSGGSVTDEGDVASGTSLIECKYSGSPEKPKKSFSFTLETLEKICDEADSIGKVPGLALRIYNPDSRLADKNGFIDVMVRLLEDDAGWQT